MSVAEWGIKTIQLYIELNQMYKEGVVLLPLTILWDRILFYLAAKNKVGLGSYPTENKSIPVNLWLKLTTDKTSPSKVTKMYYIYEKSKTYLVLVNYLFFCDHRD